jgi:hypothetical protein
LQRANKIVLGFSGLSKPFRCPNHTFCTLWSSKTRKALGGVFSFDIRGAGVTEIEMVHRMFQIFCTKKRNKRNGHISLFASINKNQKRKVSQSASFLARTMHQKQRWNC